MAYTGTLDATKPTVFPHGIQGIVVGSTGSQQSAITALTDNSAGSANNVVQAMPDPTDTPATADALRDDLVAVLLPAIRNNVADLAAKINTIITALQSAGITA